MEVTKPDFTTADGKEISIDLNRITIAQYRAIVRSDQPQEEEDMIVSTACGLSIDEYLKLGHTDWRRLIAAFFRKAREPLADPTSASASTED